MSTQATHDIATRPHRDAVDLLHIAKTIGAADARSRDHRPPREIIEPVGSMRREFAAAAAGAKTEAT